MITLYHGTDYLFNKFLFKNVGKKSGTSGAGFGLYFSSSKIDAMCYGKYVYTVTVELQNMLSNDNISLSFDILKAMVDYFETISDVSYTNNNTSSVVSKLLQTCESDTEIIGTIVNNTGQLDSMMQTLVKYGYTHSIDNNTPESSDIINYVIYDLNSIKIIEREKSLDTDTESIVESQLEDVNEYCDLMEHHQMYPRNFMKISNDESSLNFHELKENTTYLQPISNIPEPLVSLSGNMSRDNKTRSSDLTSGDVLDQATGRAKSKSQRRLMAMALAYKKGKLPDKYASDNIKKLSKTIDQDTLKDFAKTKQKKRRKDGSIGKRNNIPERVKRKQRND